MYLQNGKIRPEQVASESTRRLERIAGSVSVGKDSKSGRSVLYIHSNDRDPHESDTVPVVGHLMYGYDSLLALREGAVEGHTVMAVEKADKLPAMSRVLECDENEIIDSLGKNAGSIMK